MILKLNLSGSSRHAHVAACDVARYPCHMTTPNPPMPQHREIPVDKITRSRPTRAVLTLQQGLSDRYLAPDTIRRSDPHPTRALVPQARVALLPPPILVRCKPVVRPRCATPAASSIPPMVCARSRAPRRARVARRSAALSCAFASSIGFWTRSRSNGRCFFVRACLFCSSVGLRPVLAASLVHASVRLPCLLLQHSRRSRLLSARSCLSVALADSVRARSSIYSRL